MKSRDTRTSAGLLTPPFVTAVVLLSAAAVTAGPVAGWLRIKHEKRPLPLRKPLSALDEKAIAPYRLVERHILDPTIVEALGTEMYQDWALEDTSLPPDDPLRYVSLFITYDTGGHNLVPHTPDVCLRGAGYQPAMPHENRDLVIPALGGSLKTIPVRVCTFAKTDIFRREQVSVVYTFYCNGRFVATRTGVRYLINDLTSTYAFFSKVEVSLPRATRAQCVERATKLLGHVLPVLIETHWPDYKASEMQARQRR